VMTVNDRRAEIAILRTLGATPMSIMKIFLIHGILVGLIGTIIGTILGILAATNMESVVSFIENILHIQFFPKSIYILTRLPSDLQWSDVWIIDGIAMVLSFLATLYPSWSASQTRPSEALRYE